METSRTLPVSEVRSGRSTDGTAWDLYPAANGSPARTIALIHGLGLCRQLWNGLLPAFTAHHRVLNYDLFGHGESAPPAETASLAVYSDQLANLLDELDIASVAVVGFSIGGMINRRFALDHPSRLWALAVLSSPHDRGPEAQQAVEDRAASVRDQGALSTMDAALARWFTPAFLTAHPHWGDRVTQWRLDADPESYAQAAWVLATGVPQLVDPDPPVTAPTLVITAENDSGSTPAMSHAIAAEIDGAATIIVPGLQHLGLVEQPALFTEPVLSFLKDLSA